VTEVRIATLAEILPLRHAVLRPGEPESAARWSGDAEAVHVAAFDAGVLVGCASIGPDGWPGDLDPAAPPADPAAWRLRGMAVTPAARGRGCSTSPSRPRGAPVPGCCGRTPG
jgi:GNAT superfamily N-acetyltransferase